MRENADQNKSEYGHFLRSVNPDIRSLFRPHANKTQKQNQQQQQQVIIEQITKIRKDATSVHLLQNAFFHLVQFRMWLTLP